MANLNPNLLPDQLIAGNLYYLYDTEYPDTFNSEEPYVLIENYNDNFVFIKFTQEVEEVRQRKRENRQRQKDLDELSDDEKDYEAHINLRRYPFSRRDIASGLLVIRSQPFDPVSLISASLSDLNISNNAMDVDDGMGGGRYKKRRSKRRQSKKRRYTKRRKHSKRRRNSRRR